MIKINLNGLYNRVKVVTSFDPFTQNFTILHHSKAFTILAENLFILYYCVLFYCKGLLRIYLAEVPLYRD